MPWNAPKCERKTQEDEQKGRVVAVVQIYMGESVGRMISSSMNLVMTVLGFAVSATFIVFVCARLLCARVQRRRGRRAFSTASTTRAGFGIDVRSIERSLNGIEPAMVATFPTFKYSQEVFPSREDALCTVCLNDYAEKERLRLLPWCGHAFHTDCIDAWLRAHSTCPICRVSLRDSPDRRHLALPQMNPAIRWRFSPESLLELAGSARGVVNEEHVTANLEELQGIQQQHGDRRWNSDVFELGNDDRERLVARQQADLSLQRWSFRLWRRLRETSPAGDRAMPQNLGTESSVTININIGHLPAAEVAPCTGIPQEVTAGLGDDGRGAVAADDDDISISLQSSHCDIVESSSAATVTTGDVKDVSTEDSANVSGMNSVQQQQENIESGGVSQQRHNSRPVNLSIELNVCDGGNFGYSKAHQ